MPDDTRQKAAGVRWLSPIADVRHEEAASVLLMTVMMFLLLAAYYLLKTAREVFILTEGGAEVKSYSSAGQAVLLLFLVPAYGAFASRVDRVKLVRRVTLFFVGNLLLFVVAVNAGPASASFISCGSASSTSWRSPSAGPLPTTSTRKSRVSACFR